MKILIVLNYYWPYISGLSECARSLAEELAKDHEVTILTAKHNKELNDKEIINGVHIIRSSILTKISKGYISSDFIKKFINLQKNSDIINLHLPMMEAGLLSYLTNRKKLIVTYQCDVNLSKSVLNKLIIAFMDLSSLLSFSRARSIVVSSLDYARNSRILPKFSEKWVEIHPTSPFYAKIETKNHMDVNNRSIAIGFCGRIVEEKGIDVLLKAAPQIKQLLPNVEFIIAGDYKSVAGGSVYDKLKNEIGWDETYVKFVGRLDENDLINFYKSIDVFVLPSINSLEAFGMVQVEAMLSGTPVVASNLPGVREIVNKTGMGKIVEPGDVLSLIDGIIQVINHKSDYVKENIQIEKFFGVSSAIKKYNTIFSYT
ncbi:glycosyltransferase family 4 protein [Paenibacillus cremeus]|uniref:Glycosyltransferase family 4 protein n=1 Tax=Paenibacillus cremeus TaxID=2163881 RepID=A0A559KCC2_9BACL|nr:glycosyltransferase family 4 protein [Paenibacillus cremeus]TVY09777.1 glycosyltransferase family 4 protein [Paenibacillus cremeus]